MNEIVDALNNLNDVTALFSSIGRMDVRERCSIGAR